EHLGPLEKALSKAGIKIDTRFTAYIFGVRYVLKCWLLRNLARELYSLPDCVVDYDFDYLDYDRFGWGKGLICTKHGCAIGGYGPNADVVAKDFPPPEQGDWAPHAGPPFGLMREWSKRAPFWNITFIRNNRPFTASPQAKTAEDAINDTAWRYQLTKAEERTLIVERHPV